MDRGVSGGALAVKGDLAPEVLQGTAEVSEDDALDGASLVIIEIPALYGVDRVDLAFGVCCLHGNHL